MDDDQWRQIRKAGGTDPTLDFLRDLRRNPPIEVDDETHSYLMLIVWGIVLIGFLILVALFFISN